MGYGVATLYYQLATLGQHPLQSPSWTLGILLTLGLVLVGMKRWAKIMNADRFNLTKVGAELTHSAPAV